MVIQDHKHNLIIGTMFVYYIGFVCIPRPGEKDWACNYYVEVDKKWLRERTLKGANRGNS